MKIQSITPYNTKITTNLYNKENNRPYFTTPETKNNNFPSAQNYLNFTGGYSLDLAKTVERLDIFAQKRGGVYPPNIREWVGMILSEGNKEGETLIDIHKKFYSSLKNCFSLKEVKAKFPEFKDVLSDKEVEFADKSIVSSIKKGESEFFDKDEDLSLQLLKLYWGEGFSLNDLKKYTNGVDLYHTIKKLNIPLVDRDYGHILKISDTEYNERLTREMTAKRLASLDRKAQELEGEPVYIKRGPLSAEHRQHISDGLKKFYLENPERIYEMSDRQKDFYRQNPDKAKELTRVLRKAWRIFNADGIKKALSKFMKKNGINDFSPEIAPLDMSKKQSDLMKSFWGQNEWARKSFSKNMKYSWKKVKEENAAFMPLQSCPSQLVKYIEKTAGLTSGTLKPETMYNPYLETSTIDEASNNIIIKYTKQLDGLENVMADTYQMAVLNIVAKLKDIKRSKAEDRLISYAAMIVRENMGKNGAGYKVQTTQEAQRDFITLSALAAQSKDMKLLDVINKSLDESFELALSAHPDFMKAHPDLTKLLLNNFADK